MFTKMTVGKRVSLGFALILVLAVALGLMAIYEMKGISHLSNKLAMEYAPEVEVVSSLERNSRRIMYDMRGYGFTEDEKFLQQSKATRETLQKRILTAEKLAAESKSLVKLGPALKSFNEQVNKYDELMVKTQESIDRLAALRKEMDTSAAKYLKATSHYLENQNKQMENDFNKSSLSLDNKKERLKKITFINDAIDIANGIRVNNFRSQVLRDPLIYEQAIKDFDKVDSIEKSLIAITYKAEDKEELNIISEAKNAYKTAMIQFLKEWKDLQDVAVQRTEVGTVVVSNAEDVSKAGIEGTKTAAQEAMYTASLANTIMTWGLLITVVLGIVLSWIIIKAITGPIIKISNGLRDSSNQVSSASGQLSEASQELSSSSNQQAASIEETSSSLEEITGMVTNNVENAKRCVEISQAVNESSQKGNSSMKDLIESMQNILESNEKIQQLVKVIGEIGEKTAIIDEIVFQTKLLSFNASVEAERAGEHGRGFAVVAQEVGNLAQMSGKAATEISTIVKESIKNAEAITTENKKKVESGNQIVKYSAEVLKEISEQTIVLLENINSILSASKDQATGINQINIAVTQLDKATQENAAMAEETASSSEELNAQAEYLNGMVRELTAIVTGSTQETVTHSTNKGHEKKTQHKNNVIPLSKEKKSSEVTSSTHTTEDHSEWEAI